jgi:hypothetical protein
LSADVLARKVSRGSFDDAKSVNGVEDLIEIFFLRSASCP